MIKVCWITNIPSPYKIDLMNLLSDELEIVALFEKESESDREESWYKRDFKFKAVFLDANYKTVIEEYAKSCDILINGDYSHKMSIYATDRFRKEKKKVILQADGGLAVPRGVLDIAISYVMKKSHYFLSSGKEVDKYFNYYKIKDNIYHYRFSSLTSADIIKNQALIREKTLLKNKLGIKEEMVLFSVGQQIKRKGYDILSLALKNIDKNIGVYIAGGEAGEDVKKIIAENNLTNIHFIGFKNKEELREYYAASDIFVLPTRYDIWGLVINEAMSFGLPVISSNKCVAAVEFNNLFNNALIFENEDVDALTNCINKLLYDEKLRNRLGENSLKGIKDYTIENTKEDLVNIIKEISRL